MSFKAGHDVVRITRPSSQRYNEAGLVLSYNSKCQQWVIGFDEPINKKGSRDQGSFHVNDIELAGAQ